MALLMKILCIIIFWIFAALLAGDLVEGNRPQTSQAKAHLSYFASDAGGDSEGPANAEVIPNEDRITCLRADNLDMIFPSDPKYALRMVIPLGGPTSTQKDLYLVANTVRIDSIDFRLNLGRYDPKTKELDFTIDGGKHDVTGEDLPLATAKAHLTGLDVLTNNWFVTKVKNLMHMYGDKTLDITFNARGKFKAKKNMTEGFDLKVISMQVPQIDVALGGSNLIKVLNKLFVGGRGVGSIVGGILSGIVQDNLPPPLINLMGELTTNQFNYKVAVELSGRIHPETKLLKTNIDVDVSVNQIPEDVLGLFAKYSGDLRDKMKAQAEKILNNRRTEIVFENGRPAFIKFLEKHAFIPDEVKDFFLEAKNFSSVKLAIMELFIGQVDMYVEALQPFVNGYKTGKDILKGFRLGCGLGLDWEDNVITAKILPAKDAKLLDDSLMELLHVTEDFLTAHEVDITVFENRDGSPSDLTLGGIKYEAGQAKMKHVKAQNISFLVGNGSDLQVFQLNADLANIKLDLPKHMKDMIPFLNFYSMPGILTRIYPPAKHGQAGQHVSSERGYELGGRVGVYLDSNGIMAQVDGSKVPTPPGFVPLWRKRLSESDADGPLMARLPADMERPTEKAKALNLPWVLTNIPRASISLSMSTKPEADEKHRDLHLQLSLDADLKIDPIVRQFVAARSLEDIAYPFYINSFDYWEQPEATSGGLTSLVSRFRAKSSSELEHMGLNLVVVNCGYVRIFEHKDLSPPEVPVANVAEVLSNAEHYRSFDLSEYSAAPEPHGRKGEDLRNVIKCFEGSECCLDMNQHRTPKEDSKVNDAQVCGMFKDIQKIRRVMEEQIRRYAKDKRSVLWNFGTHPSDTEQFWQPTPFTQSQNLSVLAMDHYSKDYLGEKEEEKGAVAIENFLTEEDISKPKKKESDEASSAIEEASASTKNESSMFDAQRSEAEQCTENDARTDETSYPVRSRTVIYPNELQTQLFSMDRRQCLADLDRDRSVFPPSAYPEKELPFIRMSVPSVLPGRLTDLHVSLAAVKITHLSLMLRIRREQGNIYSFAITSVEDPNVGGDFRAYLQDLNVLFKSKPGVRSLAATLTRHSVMGIISAYKNFEDFLQATKTAFDFFSNDTDLGKEFGHKKGFAGVRILLGGKIELKGNEWQLIEKKFKARLDLADFPLGGMLETIVNTVGQPFIFKILWPLMAQAIPPQLAKTLNNMKAENGKYEHQIRLEGSCVRRGKFDWNEHKSCVGDELHLKVTTNHKLNANVRELVSNFLDNGHIAEVSRHAVSQWFKDHNPYPWLLAHDPLRLWHFLQRHNPITFIYNLFYNRGEAVEEVEEADEKLELFKMIKEAYDKGPHVFLGLMLAAGLNVSLTDAHDLSLSADADFNFPRRILETILPEDLKKQILDFMTERSQQKITTGMNFKKGVFSIPQMAISDFNLPMVNPDTHETEYLTVDLEVKEVNVKRLEAPPDDLLAPVFGEPYAAMLDLPYMDVKVAGSEKISAELPSLKATVDGSFVNHLLRKQPPPNASLLRDGIDEDQADGDIPEYYQRPIPRKPGQVNLNKFLKNFSFSVDALNFAKDRGGKDALHVGLKTSMDFTVRLSIPFFRGLTDNSDVDYGYPYVAVAGSFGEAPVRAGIRYLPPGKAVAMLSCGTLEIFSAHRKAGPFEVRHAALDLADKNTVIKYLEYFTRQWRCLHYGDKDNVFCATSKDMLKLRHAINLQVRRFKDIPRAEKRNNFTVPDSRRGLYATISSRDGTWFKTDGEWIGGEYVNENGDGEVARSLLFPQRDPNVKHNFRDPTQIWNELVRS